MTQNKTELTGQEVEVKASFDISTLEGQMQVFNAQNGSSVSMKDLPEGTIIQTTGVIQYAEQIDTYGSEQSGIVTVLFAEDGTSYASVSAPVAKAAEKLIQFFTMTGVESVGVKIVKGKSNAGRDFLNLQLVLKDK